MHDSDLTESSPALAAPTIKDRLALQQTVFQLSTVPLIISVAVSLVVLGLWYWAIQRTLNFGAQLDYSGLEAMGIDGALIKQYNPFFWWTLIAIASIIVAYMLVHFLLYMYRRTSQKVVSHNQLQHLITKLSPAALQVVLWCWESRRHPITVGVLQQSRQQLALGRYQLICLAKTHESLLQQPIAAPKDKTEALHYL